MSRTAPTPLVDCMTPRNVERFLSWVYKPADDGCWTWMGLIRSGGNTRGYGRFFVDGKIVSAHRFMWVWQNGRDPLDGHEIDHTCMNRKCVRPEHLEEVTYAENVHRSNNPAGINSRKTHCIRGHEFTSANTRLRPLRSGNLGRICIACERLRAAS